jgi:hypothetical protein
VFLDLQSTSAYMGSWYVRQPIPNGSLRDEIIAAFQTGIVVVELSSPQGVQKTTRVRTQCPVCRSDSGGHLLVTPPPADESSG